MKKNCSVQPNYTNPVFPHLPICTFNQPKLMQLENNPPQRIALPESLALNESFPNCARFIHLHFGILTTCMFDKQ